MVVDECRTQCFCLSLERSVARFDCRDLLEPLRDAVPPIEGLPKRDRSVALFEWLRPLDLCDPFELPRRPLNGLPLTTPDDRLVPGTPFLASDFAEDSLEERLVPGTPFLLSDLDEGSFEERCVRGLLLFFAVSRPKPEARLERTDC